MALHNTQCPHCLTTYVISDEQLRVSEGMVRCGTCRERFHARDALGKTEPPRFDPRKAFIEPLTEDLKKQQQAEAIADVIADAEAGPQEFTFADPKINASLSDPTTSANLSPEKSRYIVPTAAITRFDSSQLSATQMLANIEAKKALAEELRQIEESTVSTANDTSDMETNQKTAQRKLALSLDKHRKVGANKSSKTPIDSSSDETETNRKERLIDQVDLLIDNKLVSNLALTDSIKNASSSTDENTDETVDGLFQLDRKPKHRSHAWLLAPPLLIIITALIGVLMYQLWMKQILLFTDNPLVQKTITELRLPVVNKLAEYDVVLPLRRNLSKLELAVARTEAHPTRSSTTLLRISIINHARIEQPLPWLEMSLTDAEGQLVSRRALSPEDYVYQNATSNLIGARELKKVTIELLSFPKLATGYEVKILNK